MDRPPSKNQNRTDGGVSSAGEEETYTSTYSSVLPATTPFSPPPASLPSKVEPKGATAGRMEVAKSGLPKRMFRFFFHSGVLASSLRLLLLCGCLLALGAAGRSYFANFAIGPIPVAATAITAGSYLGGYVLLLLVLHLFVVVSHQQRLFYLSNFIHYISELEKYIALMVWTVGLLFALSFEPIGSFGDAYVFGSAGVRQFSVKIFAGILVASFLLAVKRHYMMGLAISFNSSNYQDRIQESLFADRILNMLLKAKHAYKFKQKARGISSPIATATRSRVDGIARSERVTFMSENSIRSVVDIFPASPTAATSPYPTPTPTTAASAAPSISTMQPLSDADKKQQFHDFFKLANKMIARFSDAADHRAEISNEATRTGEKLYKYLKSSQRSYLVGSDLQPYIEDEVEFRRAVALLKRHAEGARSSSNLSPEDAANYAIGVSDLVRAIDGILTELYVTAKSLQTIETALDKVDLFFTILVGLIMVIVVSVFMGDAVKLLLALSTLLSGAAFAFGTTARNMFESMIFLLVIHPFDVGDRVYVPLGTVLPAFATSFATMAGSDALDNVVVVEMHLLSTVFERWDGVKLYVPNYALAAKPIYNVRRSGPLYDVQRIHVDFSTPTGKIEELQRRIAEFVRQDSSDFLDIVRVVVDSMENCNRINLNVMYQHTSNWQDMDAQLQRRSKMLCFIKAALDDLQITYMPPVQRVALIEKSIGGGVSLLSAAEADRLAHLRRRIPPV